LVGAERLELPTFAL